MDYVKEIIVKVFVCQRCGHEWEPRKSADKINMCPACKSRLWKSRKDK